MTTLEAEAVKLRFTRAYRGRHTGNAYYLANAVGAFTSEDAAALLDEGVAVEVDPATPVDGFAEDAEGRPPARWAPPAPAPAPPPAPEPEPRGFLDGLIERRQAEIAAARQEAADNARRLAELDAFMAGDYPAKLEDLARRVAALEAKAEGK